MPQVFQVLRCYSCLVFQVHQTKKSNKFQCKMCGEKQSIKRHYGLGTGQECRLHVQKLNTLQGENDASKEVQIEDDVDDDSETIKEEPTPSLKRKSKWSSYVETENNDEAVDDGNTENMYLNNIEVVLEMPKKIKKKTNAFQTPMKRIEDELTNDRQDNKDTKINVINKLSIPLQTEPIRTFREIPSKPKAISFREISPQLKDIHHKIISTNSEILNHYVLDSEKPKTSKWDQFVDEEDLAEAAEDSDISSTLDSEQFSERKGLVESHTQPPAVLASQDNNNMFALCNDNELDDVLDF